MSPSSDVRDPTGPEHFLAAFYGLVALCLGAAAWSGAAAVFGTWSLAAAPGLGWLVAWACRHGGRTTDTLVRVIAWLLASAGCLAALFVFSAFSARLASPDAGVGLRGAAMACLRLFTEPPWFGSAAVLLTLAGAWRALRDPAGRLAPRAPAVAPARDADPRPDGGRPGAGEPDERAA